MISYLLTVTGSLLLFYALYAALLHRLTFYRWNRIFIFSAIALSLLLPLLEAPQSSPTLAAAYEPVLVFTGAEKWTEAPGIQATDTRTNVVAYIYIAGVALMLLFLGGKALRLYKLFRTGERESSGPLIIIRTASLNASFFRTIFLQKGLSQAEEIAVLRHESAHARRYHSVDNIAMEILKVIGWFNPVLYLFHRRLKELHEFEADAIVAQQLGRADYARMLIKLNTEKDIQLLNLYGSHPLKKRIRFLFNSNSHHMKKLMYLLILPCFVLGMFSFAPLTANGTNEASGTGFVLTTKNGEKRLVINLRDLLGEKASWKALEDFERNAFPKLRAAFLEEDYHLNIESKVMGDKDDVKELGISLEAIHGRVSSTYRVEEMIRNNYIIVIGYNKKEKTIFVHGAAEKEMKE